MNQYIKTIIFVIIVISCIFSILYFGREYISSTLFQETKVSPESNIQGNVTIGSKAPYFSLQSYQGENINSSDTADNPLVITFWSTWNSESIDQVKIFDDYQLGISNKNKDMSARIILVNSQESKEVVSNIMRRGNYDLEVLLDQNGEVSNLYGVHTLPTTFFIDRSGDIVEIFTGTMNKNELINKMEGIIF